MERKFKVGDRVKVIKNSTWGFINGKTGRVIGCVDDQIAVEFDSYINGHDGELCGHVGKSGYCWYLLEKDLELINNIDKLIFRDNATILIKNGKRYVAKCCEGDTYDKEKGLLVCLAKAHGYTFDDLQKMLEDAEEQGKKPNNAVKEVKREAKAGEYIKIVDRENGENYHNGDIFKVKESNFTGVRAYCKGKGNTGGENYNYIHHEEYVVLENYRSNKYKITLSEFWKSCDKLAIKYKNEKQGKLIYDTLIKKGFYNKINHNAKYAKGFCCILNDKHCKGCFINQGGAMDDYKKFNFNEVDLNN